VRRTYESCVSGEGIWKSRERAAAERESRRRFDAREPRGNHRVRRSRKIARKLRDTRPKSNQTIRPRWRRRCSERKMERSGESEKTIRGRRSTRTEWSRGKVRTTADFGTEPGNEGRSSFVPVPVRPGPILGAAKKRRLIHSVRERRPARKRRGKEVSRGGEVRVSFR